MDGSRSGNTALAERGLPALDLADPETSRVWRFELRMGSKQLRNRWEMRSWLDVREKIGDAFAEFCKRIRYTSPTQDSNRARWPNHPMWKLVERRVTGALEIHRLGVDPETVKERNRSEHMRMLDTQILGLLVSRAAASGVGQEDFEDFVEWHSEALLRLSDAHPRTIGERINKAVARYRFK